MDSIRRSFINSKRVVVKIGSSSLTHNTGKINFNKIDRLARQLVDLRNQNKDVVLVTSGAIAVGCDSLGIKRPDTLPYTQATAAVGQAILMQIYRKTFAEYNQTVAQILLTKDVFDFSERRQNAKNTFDALFDMGVIPIVNENDTVATDEIEFGDNDTLSAEVSKHVSADLLILLSDIDGLFTEDPRKNPEAKLIETVKEIDEDIIALAGGAGTSVGTGGMATKLKAARIALDNHFHMVIANANDLANIERIIKGESIGTLFTK